MLKQKERVLRKEIEASSLNNLKKPIRLLLEMNDVTGINWKKISRMMPISRTIYKEGEKIKLTTDEVKKDVQELRDFFRRFRKHLLSSNKFLAYPSFVRKIEQNQPKGDLIINVI